MRYLCSIFWWERCSLYLGLPCVLVFSCCHGIIAYRKCRLWNMQVSPPRRSVSFQSSPSSGSMGCNSAVTVSVWLWGSLEYSQSDGDVCQHLSHSQSHTWEPGNVALLYRTLESVGYENHLWGSLAYTQTDRQSRFVYQLLHQEGGGCESWVRVWPSSPRMKLMLTFCCVNTKVWADVGDSTVVAVRLASREAFEYADKWLQLVAYQSSVGGGWECWLLECLCDHDNCSRRTVPTHIPSASLHKYWKWHNS